MVFSGLVQDHGEWAPFSECSDQQWEIGNYFEQNKNVNYIQVIRAAWKVGMNCDIKTFLQDEFGDLPFTYAYLRKNILLSS